MVPDGLPDGQIRSSPRQPVGRSGAGADDGHQRERQWEDTLVHRSSVKALAIVTFLTWACIIVLGRLIAYDHVWGSWSPAVGQ